MTSGPVCFLGEDRAARADAVRRHLDGREHVEVSTAPDWPFLRNVVPPASPASIIWIRDLHLAFPAAQTPGTRLVLTQSTYQLQRWLDWLERNPDVQLIADAHRSTLQRASPEALAARGPWGDVAIVDVAGVRDSGSEERAPAGPLQEAFLHHDPRRRLEACNRAVSDEPGNPAFLLALASVCMELQLLDDASAALDGAVALDPDWEAAHFERGKLWLRLEETERAAAAFAEAGRLMPRFAAALLNLGAALGELGRRTEALTALQQALRADPRSHTALNNLGAVYREDGLLDDAERAFRGVIALAPAFVFGYYNLGQTLLLKGNVGEARRTYEDGYARDAQKNARQACRLAVARAADGDADGALALIGMLAGGLPGERAAEVFREAESTIGALSTRREVDPDAIARLQAAIRSYSS